MREMAEQMTKEREAAQKTVEAVGEGVEEIKAGEPTKGAMRVAEQIPVDAYMYATLGSIIAALVLFFRNKENGIFVGLWAPTILNLGLLYKLIKPSRGTV